MYPTEYEVRKEKELPSFARAARRYIRGSRVEGVEQVGFERLVVFSFRRREQRYRLMCELLPRGSLVLVNEENRILACSEAKRFRDRVIAPGRIYSPPAAVTLDPLSVSKEALTELLTTEKGKLTRVLAVRFGLGRIVAERVVTVANLNLDVSARQAVAHVEQVLNALQSVVINLLRDKVVVAFDAEEKVPVARGFSSVFAYKPSDLKHVEIREFEDPIEAFDFYFTYQRFARYRKTKLQVLEKERKRLKRIIEEQERAIAEYKRAAAASRRVAEILQTYGQQLQHAVNEYYRLKKPKNLDAVQRLSPLPLHREPDGSIAVEVEGRRLVIPPGESIFRIAAQLYDRAKRFEEKARRALRLLEETKKRAYEPIVLEPPKKRKRVKRRWFDAYLWFITSDGFLVVGGRDASQNEALLKRHAESHDLVFHADVHGAPFVLLKTEGREPPEQSLKEAAQFAAAYSRAWRIGVSAVDVYCVKPEQVSKQAPSGEYLPKGAFMVYGKRKYFRGVPLHLAVGVVEQKGSVRLMAGPPPAIKGRASVYVILAPDPQRRRIVEDVWQKLVDQYQKKRGVGLPRELRNELQRIIPGGVGRLLKDV